VPSSNGASRVAFVSLVHTCQRQYPGGTTGCCHSLAQQRRPSRSINTVGFRISIFEACSAFTHIPACMLARSPSVTIAEGFDRFVASTVASTASGCSDPSPGGTCTHWKTPPLHGALMPERYQTSIGTRCGLTRTRTAEWHAGE